MTCEGIAGGGTVSNNFDTSLNWTKSSNEEDTKKRVSIDVALADNSAWVKADQVACNYAGQSNDNGGFYG